VAGGSRGTPRCAQTEQWLLPAEAGHLEAEGMERTYRFSQEALAKSADATSARKAFDLSLPQLGPYCLDYTPNGRHLLLGGRKGHLALVDWQRQRLTTEIQARAHPAQPRRAHRAA
jgi:U3 small nucleolar RNA-associated protein 7